MFSMFGIIYSLVTVGVLIQTAHSWSYQQIFRDDFNGNSIDWSKWNSVNVASTVNAELQHYVNDETYLNGQGQLIIRSRKRNYGGREYTSGRVDTRFKFSFTYGEVEWRAKLPKGKGIWPALWLLRTECPAATPCGAGLWPPEIDVMEARGDITNKITHAIHFGVYPNNNHDTKEVFGPDYTAGFHTYKVLWDPNQIIFYVDGQETYRTTDKNKIPTQPLYLIMNTAVGGWYPGNPDASTHLPTEFAIDYVTVHRWQD